MLYLSSLLSNNKSGSHGIAEQFLTVTTNTSNVNPNTFRWGSKTRHFYYFYICSQSTVVLFYFEMVGNLHILIPLYSDFPSFFVLFSYSYSVEGYKWTRVIKKTLKCHQQTLFKGSISVGWMRTRSYGGEVGVMVFNATFNSSYIMAVSFIGVESRRKPPTCRKSLTNFIT